MAGRPTLNTEPEGVPLTAAGGGAGRAGGGQVQRQDAARHAGLAGWQAGKLQIRLKHAPRGQKQPTPLLHVACAEQVLEHVVTVIGVPVQDCIWPFFTAAARTV